MKRPEGMCRTTLSAQLAAFLQRNYSVMSGVLLFTTIAAMQSISTGHLSTGLSWVFPMDTESDVDDLLATNLAAEIQAPEAAVNYLADGRDIDGGGKDDGLPTVLQVFVLFGFLAAQSFITTTLVNVLVLTKVITRDTFVYANFLINQAVFFVMLLLAGADFVKALLLTMSFFVACTIFVTFVITLFRQQIQLIGGELGVQVVQDQDPDIVFGTDA